MKKTIKIISATVVILGIILYSLYINGFFVTDYSARLGESNRLIWNGRTYWGTNDYDGYELGRLVVKGEPNLKLYEIKNDPDHNYFFSSGFRDSELYKAQDYDPDVNKSGEIKRVVWGERIIKNADFLTAINDIESQKISNYDYQTSDISKEIPNEQVMEKLYYEYEKSPFPDVSAGYLGKIKGNWVITTYIPQNTIDYNYEENKIIYKEHIVRCYLLPEKYHNILEKASKN